MYKAYSVCDPYILFSVPTDADTTARLSVVAGGVKYTH